MEAVEIPENELIFEPQTQQFTDEKEVILVEENAEADNKKIEDKSISNLVDKKIAPIKVVRYT